jgi:hypothetical protein
MIETFEKNEAVSLHTITSTGCKTVISNCNDYQTRINQIVRIEAKDSRGNVVFSIDGGDITISVENNRLEYHYF